MKKYKTYTITPSGNWFAVHNNGELLAKVPYEEEGRRVIWINEGKGDPITEEMMIETK